MTSETPTPSRPAGRRNCKVNVRLSAPEKATIERRAAQTGMKPSQFMRRAALTCPLPSPPSPAPRLLAPGGGRQKFNPPPLLGFAFVLALAVAMALLVSTEAEGTNSAHAAEEDASPAPPEISEPTDAELNAPTPEIPAPSVEEDPEDLVPVPPPYIAPPYIAPPAYGLHSQISDLKSDILLMKLVAAGAGLILFIAVVGRVFSARPLPPLESPRDREIEALLAALERQGAVLGNVGQVLAERLRVRSD